MSSEKTLVEQTVEVLSGSSTEKPTVRVEEKTLEQIIEEVRKP